MRDPRVLVQDPPVGKFTFDNLLFTKKPRSTGKVAYIPRDRFEDLKTGQGEKESCQWARQRSEFFKESENVKINNYTILESVTLHCCHGPQDLSGAAEIRQLGPDERRRKIAAGESIKVGCTAHFRATIYYKEPSVVEINVLKVSNAFVWCGSCSGVYVLWWRLSC
jgi:hypothetical protein